MRNPRSWIAAICLVLSTNGLAQAQVADSPASGAADTTGGAAENASPPGSAPATSTSVATEPTSLTVLVTFPDGRPVFGATAVMTASGSNESDEVRTRITDDAGAATFYPLVAGRYDIEIEYGGARSVVSAFPALRADTTRINISGLNGTGAPNVRQTLVTIGCLLLYLLSILLVRRHNIAQPVHEMMKRQIGALKTRLETEVVPWERDGVGNPTSSDGKAIVRLQETVKELEASLRDGDGGGGWGELLFWSRGRETGTWVAIHEVERQMAAFLAPPEYVEVYLRSVQAELRAINKPQAMAVADAIQQAIAVPIPRGEAGEAALRTRKVLLGRALAIVYSSRDAGFSTLMEWQNKANWLLLAAVIATAFLVAVAGNSVLLLAGATGGFLSRLMRALRRDDVPLDYGASWTTLFLSPLFGALSAWFGIALITLLSARSLNLLGDAFRQVGWDDPLGPGTLAIAFLLGFSERFFGAVVGAVETHALRKEEARADATRQVARDSSSARLEAPARVGAAAPVLAITSIERRSVAAGNSADELLIKGTGFVAGATVMVNDQLRTVKSTTEDVICLSLSSDDVNRIDMGGDFVIVVVNPDGALSQPFEASEPE